MTQDQTHGREPVPSFTPISATRIDNPKQTEFKLVSPAPPETEPEARPETEADAAGTSPATPVPTVPSQARRDAADTAPDIAAGNAPDDAADSTAGSTTASAAGNGGRLADGEELMPGADAGKPLAPGGLDEELPPSGAGPHEPPANSGLDDTPLLSGVEELRAGWQRVRIAFVDNPRGAVGEAAGLTDEAAEALAAALRERRHRIRATWESNGPDRDTEALRLALLRYQALFSKIVGDLPHGAHAHVRQFHLRRLSTAPAKSHPEYAPDPASSRAP